jgi:hypothetical protein
VKAPCTSLNAESCFPSYDGSELARVIRDANIFVWDEGSIARKHLMTGIDRHFKDLMQDVRPFGGKLVVKSGGRDIRQNFHIGPGEQESQITHECLKRSKLWSTVTKLGLT